MNALSFETPGSTSTSNNLPFIKEQLDLLYKIIQESNVSSSSTSCAFAQLGTFKTTLSTSSILHSNSWIIDSRATYHMTKESNICLSYISHYNNQKVEIANGSLTPISGKANVPITHNITFSSVLHVSNVSCNLLSINKLTKSQNCSITFYYPSSNSQKKKPYI